MFKYNVIWDFQQNVIGSYRDDFFFILSFYVRDGLYGSLLIRQVKMMW